MKLPILLLACVLSMGAAIASEDAPKRIAFTFDDAPRGDGAFFTGAERAVALIAALEAAEVKGAMMFVTTRGIVDRAPEGAARIRRYAEAGLVLGNHSHTHQWLRRTEAADYLADLVAAADILDRFEGVAPFYRFPYLDEGRPEEQRDAVRAGLTARGLKNGYVTIDTYDWHMAALANRAKRAGWPLDMDALRDAYVEILMAAITFYDEVALDYLGRSPAHVLLLHENDLAALFVDDLAAALRADGWEIIPALEAYDDPIAAREPETLFLGQGRVAALAHEMGATGPRLVSPTEDEAYLEAEFVRRGLYPPSS